MASLLLSVGRKTRRDERGVGPHAIAVRRHLSKDVALVEVARRPADVPQEHCSISCVSPCARETQTTNWRGRNPPSELAFWYATCWHMNVSHDATFPPPVSVLNACRPLQRSHSASGAHALSMLFVTQSSCVPELSESRYLCTSKMRFVTLPSGFVTFLSASAEPFETKVSADVQLLPGRRMICEVALHHRRQSQEQ